MEIKQIFFILSVVVGFITQGIGIWAVLKGNFRPQRTTRFIYFLMGVVVVGTLVAQKSWDSLGFALAQNICGMIIFGLSFKYGVGGFAKFDLITLFGAGVAGFIWITTGDPTKALLFGILTDAIAFLPTLKKIWVWPRSEEWRFYASDVMASSFSYLSLRRMSVGDLAYPVYIFGLNVVAMVLILMRRKVVKNIKRYNG